MALDEDTYFLIGNDDDVNADLILVKHHLSFACPCRHRHVSNQEVNYLLLSSDDDIVLDARL